MSPNLGDIIISPAGLIVKTIPKTKSLVLYGILFVINVGMLLNTIISGDYLAITIMNHIR